MSPLNRYLTRDDGRRDLTKYLVENYYTYSPDQQMVQSSHWKYYSDRIKVELDVEGNLASLTGEGFGGYNYPSLHQKFLEYLATGIYLTILPRRIEKLKLWDEGRAIIGKMGLDPSLDFFRQICTLAFLREIIKNHLTGKTFNVLLIGDGYGVLAALTKHFFPKAVVHLLDLGKILLFQAHHCRKAFPNLSHVLADEIDSLPNADFIYCPADHLKWLDARRFDLAINIASMQEMKQETIVNYFNFLRTHFNPDHLFYCCNREEKQMPDGEFSRFYDYPWDIADNHLVDEECPWHKFFLSFRRTKNGPKLFGLRLPLVQFYDGKHLHRLTKLKTINQ